MRTSILGTAIEGICKDSLDAGANSITYRVRKHDGYKYVVKRGDSAGITSSANFHSFKTDARG